MRSLAVRSRCRETQRLQDELAQIFLLHNRHEPVAHIRAVDADVLALQVRSVEADFFDNSLQDRVQTAGADILRSAIDLEGDVGQSLDTVTRELQLDALRGEQ